MSRSVVTRGLRYAKNGPPSRVLTLDEWAQPFSPSGSDAVVKMVAAPVHHHDRWAVQGAAGNAPVSGPTVGGSEGVGVVQEVGSGCRFLEKGQHVVVNTPGVGTWADHLVVAEDKLDRVPADLQPEDASLIGTYGAAWQMVHGFGKIKHGDVCWVLGTGAVATATACLLQQKGAVVVMVMRAGRPNEADLQHNIRQHLPTATAVRTSHLSDRVMLKITSDMPKPKFIFNGMGGQALREAVRFAAEGCKVVSFGNMSGEKLQVSVGRHLYQDLQLLPFRYQAFLKNSTREQREAMYEQIAEVLRCGAHGNSVGADFQWRSRLFIRSERYEFERFHKHAIANSSLLFQTRKPILRFGEEYEWTHSGEWFKEYEYFLPNDQQYVENMKTPHDERHMTEYSSFETGGPILATHFNELWDTEIAKEARKEMLPLDMQKDQYAVTKDSYIRYMEQQGAKYGINLTSEVYTSRRGESPLRLPGSLNDGAFFPDDDPVIAKTLL